MLSTFALAPPMLLLMPLLLPLHCYYCNATIATIVIIVTTHYWCNTGAILVQYWCNTATILLQYCCKAAAHCCKTAAALLQYCITYSTTVLQYHSSTIPQCHNATIPQLCMCAHREPNRGHKHGRLVWWRCTMCASDRFGTTTNITTSTEYQWHQISH